MTGAPTAAPPDITPDTVLLPSLRRWAAVTAVAFGSFSLVLSEFLPIGLLSDIAAGLDVSSGTAGLLVVMPGLAAAVSAPAAALVAGRADRKVVLLFLAALLVVSNGLAAVSPNLGVMLIARLLLGVGVGGFWVFGTSVAPRLVAPSQATRATALVTSGIALATVASLPLGALIGSLTTWRVAFAAAAVLALLALIAQILLLPSLLSTTRNTVVSLLQIVGKPRSRTVLIASVATFLAQFGAYTYLEPYLKDRVHFTASSVTLVLLGFGLAGLAGNFGFTRLIDRAPNRAVLTFLTLTGVCIAVLPWIALSGAGATAVVVLWGLFWGALPLGLQVYMMRTAGPDAESGQAMFVSTIQISLAAGSALGGIASDLAGLTTSFQISAAFALAGAVLIVVRTSREDRQPA